MSDPSGRDLAAILVEGDWTYGPGTRRLAAVPTGPDGRCVDGCLSEEQAFGRANPGSGREFGDGASMRCHSCGGPVCICCGTTAAPLHGWICTPCGEAAVDDRP